MALQNVNLLKGILALYDLKEEEDTHKKQAKQKKVNTYQDESDIGFQVPVSTTQKPTQDQFRTLMMSIHTRDVHKPAPWKEERLSETLSDRHAKCDAEVPSLNCRAIIGPTDESLWQ